MISTIEIVKEIEKIRKNGMAEKYNSYSYLYELEQKLRDYRILNATECALNLLKNGKREMALFWLEVAEKMPNRHSAANYFENEKLWRFELATDRQFNLS
jgi:hypothetical protein